MYNYCFRRLGSWAAAEDILSVVFLEAWRRREKELPEDKVAAVALWDRHERDPNQRRSERRFAAALRRMPEPPPEASFTDRADERLDDETQMRRAHELLGQLPRHEREVFALCDWMELSYEDAALALGVPLGTVRSRSSRARRRLRELDPAIGHEEGSTKTVQEALEP